MFNVIVDEFGYAWYEIRDKKGKLILLTQDREDAADALRRVRA